MATLNISATVPDAEAAQITDDLCASWGYTAADGAKPAFIKKNVLQDLKNRVMNQRVKAAGIAAEIAAAAAVDSTVTFT